MNLKGDYVRGIHIPDLNPVQAELVEIFVEEREGQELERIDHIEVINDVAVRIFTSRFIELSGFYGKGLNPHLQIMSTYRAYDENPEGDHVQDPYIDHEMDRRYREVRISSVYRTLRDDPGWVVGMENGKAVHEPDSSPLYVWDGNV